MSVKTFPMPISRIPIKHPAKIEHICKEYWLWVEDHWEIRADWWDWENERWVTCRHCETDHNLKFLIDAAITYGFKEQPVNE